MGVAIGDALGFAREGLSRRTALKMFGRPKLKYQLVPRTGFYSDDTHLMLMAAQSVLRSHSEWRPFRRSYLNRLAWYPLSIPAGAGRATITAAFKSWLRVTGLPTGCNSAGNGPVTRALFLTLALHGTDHRTLKWVEDSTRLTHNNSLAVDGTQTLARLVQIAATTHGKTLDSVAALNQLIAACKEPELKQKLEQLVPFLEQSRSPSSVARHFGWSRGISGYIVSTAVMATYCFLRYPTNFDRAVLSAVGLGGDTDSVAAIVGGLVGAHIGIEKLPPLLVRQQSVLPHNAAWMEEMAERMSHWPHGAEDLHLAPALPSEPLLQLLRNIATLLLVFVHLGLRAPFVFLARSQPSHLRRRRS